MSASMPLYAPSSRHRWITRASALALLSLSLGCDLIQKASEVAVGEQADDDSGSQTVQLPAPSAAPPPLAVPKLPPAPAMPPDGAPMSFADLAKQANPSVVFVRTVSSQRQGFHRILRPGTGSGFIFDPGGKILTNYHVVSGAHAIQVELHDGRALMGNVVGADPLTDLAVVDVDAEDLPALALGDSDEIRVGDWVVAIGNPFGLEHTVSAGIISAKERTGRDVQVGDPDAYYSFLQTDASINPGNSGGPLIDLHGHVVGINTAINQSANNIGFAIPVNMVRDLLPRLLKDGAIKRAAIGVQVGDVSLDDLQRFKLPDRNGAIVARVIPRSPADAAGLRPGDVIVEFDGKLIRSPEDLRWRASLAEVGKEVTLAILRGGQKADVSLRPAPLQTR